MMRAGVRACFGRIDRERDQNFLKAMSGGKRGKRSKAEDLGYHLWGAPDSSRDNAGTVESESDLGLHSRIYNLSGLSQEGGACFGLSLIHAEQKINEILGRATGKLKSDWRPHGLEDVRLVAFKYPGTNRNVAKLESWGGSSLYGRACNEPAVRSFPEHFVISQEFALTPRGKIAPKTISYYAQNTYR
ncbi:uncharacterized protein MYCFIDRAFT_178706 [Pseudocercospora fijiensis CIRAD86]|uniref:Uncharacterized protein n=1 Tax=Pseudocercospora fijiensis (strain CIRAD86) TaxID=383855 RepID=M2ZHG6_PSEFD|nr:uncharacterized protein MYCFIDRAFT_178706 [Pseudocercospora fijiensis CIRAD86]EME78579.1 hypothetical protein MYCFIDRAFT_178706 [Pseudocercospora fijiensis CIRAD86]